MAFTPKYTNKYKLLFQYSQDDQANPPDLREIHFDPETAYELGLLKRLLISAYNWLNRNLILPLLMWSGLRLRFPFTWVVRYDEVVAILCEPKIFKVPFGVEMTDLGAGRNFALGDDGTLHQRQRAIMVDLFSDPAIVEQVCRATRLAGEAVLDDCGGQLNVVRDYITRVTTHACLDTYGIETDNADDFAEYSMAGSSLLFADPFGNIKYRQQALIGAKRLREIIAANIRRMEGQLDQGQDVGPGMLAKLVITARADPQKIAGPGSDYRQAVSEIIAMMLGMITGFVPTNSLGASHVLEELSRRPEQFEKACGLAALVADGKADAKAARQQLNDLLLEAARLNPALFPGQFRHVNGAADHDGVLARLGFRDDETIMVSTGMALRDPRQFPSPNAFIAGRFNGKNPPINLLFGYGIHACIGHVVAMEVITELFATLLARKDIRFTSARPKMRRVGPLPWQMDMAFEPDRGDLRRAMVTSAIPLKAGADDAALRQMLKDGFHDGSVKSAIDASGIVHFMSLNVIDLGEENKPRPTLLVEINADGTAENAVRKIVAHCPSFFEAIRPFLDYKPMQGKNIATGNKGIADHIIDHMVTFRTRPFGAIGLNFPGSGEFSVDQLEKEQKLFDWVRRNVFLSAAPAGSGTFDSMLDAARHALKHGGDEVADLRALLIRPTSRRPAFSRVKSSNFNTFLVRLFTSAPFTTAALLLLAMSLVVPALVGFFGHWSGILPAYVDSLMAPLLLLATAAAAFVWVLRRHETVIDKPDDRFASREHMEKILAGEDIEGYAQNHLTSVSQMKPGSFRLITMALAMYIIKRMAEIWFKPGFVTDFATIHYAKWFRLPGTRKLIFQTNYDGSWESYLEDFITLVHGGQTMAWNNGIGFPRTNWFFLDGARDGDRFKRWVRRQQVENLFWYSRFPQLTLAQKHVNALVRDGLARASTASEKEGWAALFGSSQKAATSIESDQIQNLLFGGLGRHPCGELIAVAFDKTDRRQAGQWVGKLLRNRLDIESASPLDSEPGKLTATGIAFGEAYPGAPVRFVAFSSSGLQFLGFEEKGEAQGLSSFPASFQMGMARRGHILGDVAIDKPNGNHAGTDGGSAWNWSDCGEADDKRVCHAILLHYARDEAELARLSQLVEDEASTFGLRIVRRIAMPAGSGQDFREPFGFRDGISQPVISGMRNFRRSQPDPDNVVGPGEFILGYPDTRGFIAPSPQVSVGYPGAEVLPAVEEALPGNDLQFDHPQAGDLRDFGRNGSFLVIRQLAQDSHAFSQFCEWAASQSPDVPTGKGKAARYWHLAETERVKSKIFGRWPDGSTLTANPVMSASRHNRQKMFDLVRERLAKAKKATAKAFSQFDRDGVVWDEAEWERFLAFVHDDSHSAMIGDLPAQWLRDPVAEVDLHHGADDPQGRFCPLGSHIRRTNPRDSLRPGNPVQTEINNRHRLLRRGRRYEDNGEEGTLFMCFNTNIERQFEFIQQTWVNSRVFHGLRNSPDPLLSSKKPGDVFTIQGAFGNRDIPLDGTGAEGIPMANFVTMRGGGYFFMPGRQALEFLARVSQQ